ncbi:hypothetical protein FOCC_FOCC006215, partial [Frankliniella occidentalis]
MDVCVLCDGRNVGDLVCVERGIERIRYASKLKEDGICDKVDTKVVAGVKILVHPACRKNYTSHLKERSEEKENNVPVKRRSSSTFFDFKCQCLYCGRDLKPCFGSKTPERDRAKICSVTSADAKTKILERAQAVGGDQGDAVICRISCVLDLQAVNCRYHLDCYRKFQPAVKTPGRPVNERSRSAFDILCDELEADSECQFSVNELAEKLNKTAAENSYSPRYLKELLKSRFGKENVIFTDFAGKNSVFCFRGKANRFVYDHWHSERISSGENDRTRIVKAAAKIIREDIRMRAFDNDTYLIGGSLDEECMVPDSLRLLLSETIKSSTDSKQSQRSREAIAQSIVAACRPRSYISPIQLHLSMYVFLNEGSRHLIDLLHNLGVAASYNESRRFVGSLLNSERPEENLEQRFKQWAFDNADYNVRTLDGHRTFHNMGGISCSTPRPLEPLPFTVPRIKGKIVMDVSKGRIPVITYVKPAISSFKSVFAADLRVKRSFPKPKFSESPKTKESSAPLPSWSGYMEVAHANSGPYDVSTVEYLPFINLDPTNLSCIFTALNFASDQCEKQKQKHCAVTFDLPLFMKATEISNGCPELKKVIVMLGGFHLIMSFLGCIGEIMSGSGLEDLFATVYAQNSVPHMMSGHAYARSMRAHSLAQQALSTIILKEAITEDNALLSELASLHKGLMSKENSCEEPLPLANKIRGYFAVRHQDLYFKGVPMDLTIEQKLMRHLKTSGLTRGRGITESTLAQFVAALPHCVPLCHNLEAFCGVRSASSEQHVELRASWQVRDSKDRDQFLAWLEAHPPFEERPQDMLVSLSTGIVADSSINCDMAWEIGFKSMKSMHGQNFADLKLKRKDKVKSLAAMTSNIKIAEEEVTINPNQLLNRIICMLDLSSGSLSDYLEYELSPTAPSLFDEVSLRKTDKAALAKAIDGVCAPQATPVPPGTPYVVDGGMLLRAVVWPRPASFGEICETYRAYVVRRYGPNSTIVFDGYGDHLSTKAAEQLHRCSGKTSPNLTIRADTMVTTAQANFLGNGANKTSLICLLKPVLESAGLSVVQAQSDADTLIVEKALERASSHPVAVAANDTDILALLVQRMLPKSPIYMHCPGTSGRPDKVYDIKKVQAALGPLQEVILAMHALTGCDTTSAMFGRGKVGITKLLPTKEDLIKCVALFNDPDANLEEIVEAGEKVISAVYGNQNKSLNELRFSMFNKLVARQKLSADFHLKVLPPTSGAARQHSLRVYLQVQQWLGRTLDPTKYGWKLAGNRLVAVSSDQPVAPKELLDLIRCSCKKGCQKGCECKR